MILDIIVHKTDDGFTAEMPTLKGLDVWASSEDEVLDKAIEMAKYYCKIDENSKLKVDKARGNFNQKVYKLVFNR